MNLHQFPSPAPELYDELSRHSDEWSWLDSRLGEYSEAELQTRWAELARGLRDSTPHWGPRRWDLDPLPAVLGEADWRRLEAGLLQRARLLNAVLQDAYGQQSALREGWLPPALVHDNPLWLTPCHGMVDSELARLMFYAVDVVRGPDGNWRVVRDRTQCPPGFGSILHNRRWMARAYHELFAEHRIQPIAPVFQGLRQALGEVGQSLAGPRVVMLTSAAGSPQSADDAALAQFLGCALVEGEDLSVRGGSVYLKLLEGLQPVELIVRRIADSGCDPLEMPNSGLGGVVALLQAVRNGNVVVSNSLGSGWLASPALTAYLPGLCREFLGEPLLLPALASHWGDQLPAGEDWVARPFRGGPPQLLPEWPADRRRRWLEQCRPRDWVFQEYCQPSTFPCIHAGLPRRLPGVVRCYLVSTPEGYRLIPGGLVRLRAQPGGPIFSKDLWRLSTPPDAADLPFQPAPVSRGETAVSLSRSGGDVPSRVAEQFYWFGRYLERCESSLRLARCIALRRTQEEDPERLRNLEALLQAQPGAGLDLNAWANGHGDDQLQALLQHLRRLGGSLRDRVSADLPRVLATLPEWESPLEPGRVLGYLEELSIPIWALVAVARESLYRGYGFRFLEIGRRLERARQICELLRGFQAPDWPSLELLLEVTDSSRTYRRRYPAGLEWTAVLDLLLADDTHPRSLAYQLRSLEEHFQHLPARGQVNLAAHQRALFQVRSELQLWQPPEPAPLALLQERLGDVAQGLTAVYLTHLKAHFQGGSREV